MASKQIKFEINEDNSIGNIIDKPIEKVLPDSMMPYSEYVIMDRALPRVEDGLKPVQRRILYAMYDLGMKPEGAYKKSARVVGECLGKYHPHGDRSVYDAMVRMAQDFNMRMTLVDGHGNFGSIDGDCAAAMRYTEVKMAPLAIELLRDIEKGTVKWNKNFDDTLEEPDILPGRFPNLLVNGATGIAIGLATNIPPHNLTEVIDGCIAMIDEPRIKLTELVKIIKGPDFPTGGFIVGGDGIVEMYEKGHGKVLMRAKADIENTDGNRQNIVITEIPYNVNKENLQKKIFDLKERKKDVLGGITDVADESDRNGMRIVVKLKRGEDAAKILEQLFKSTDLECNFNVNIVAIANGRPKQLGLIPILKYYLEFQRSVVYKRSQYEIGIAKKRAHILDGLTLILPAIDEVIAIIRNSASRSEAKSKLRDRFTLSDAQAEAILSLQLGNINKLDVTKYEKELAELNKKITALDKILGSVREQDKVVKEELIEIRDKYKSKRLTTIVDSLECLEIKPFDPTKRAARRAMIAADSFGGIKVMSCRNYVSAVRDVETSGIEGLTLSLVQAEPENTNIIFGSLGNAYRADTEFIKEKRWGEKGEPLTNIYPDAPADEKAVCVITATEEDGEKDFYIYTKNGMVKKTMFKNYIVNKDVYQAVVLKEGDEVIGGEFAAPEATIFFVTSDGLCVNTLTDDYPVQGRIAGGVIGVSLNDGESVIYAGQTTVEAESAEGGTVVWNPVGEVAVITSKGFAKKVLATEFEPIKRNRKGVKIIDMDNSSRLVFASKVLEPFEVAIIDTDNNLTVLDTENMRLDSRTGKGRPIARGLKISKIVKHIEEF